MRKSVLAIGTALALVGCGSNSLRPARAPAPPEPIDEREAATLYVSEGRCDRDDQPRPASLAVGAILAPIIGIAADFAVGALSESLKRLRSGRNAVWFAANSTALVASNPSVPTHYCLALSRGFLVAGSLASQHRYVLPASLAFNGEPAFVLLADLELTSSSGGRTSADSDTPTSEEQSEYHVTLRPYRLDYGETAARRRGSGRKDLSVVIALSSQTLQPAGEPASTPSTEKAGAVLRLDFGRLEVGRQYSRPILLPVVAGATITQPAGPTTFTAIVTESEDSTLALDAFIAAFENNEDDLAEALRSVLGGGDSESDE